MFASKRAISLSYYLEHLGKVGNIWTKHKIYTKNKKHLQFHICASFMKLTPHVGPGK